MRGRVWRRWCAGGGVGRRRAEVEDVLAARAGGFEIAAPCFDHSVGAEIAQADVHGAKPAGRETDDCATRTVGDRPEARVDPAGQVVGDRLRPVLGRGLVEVLRIAVERAGSLSPRSYIYRRGMGGPRNATQ